MRRQHDNFGWVGFLINADGAWLRLGTLEATMETHGSICIEYAKSMVSDHLDPSSVAQLALASLQPRLSVIEPTFPREGVPPETCASVLLR